MRELTFAVIGTGFWGQFQIAAWKEVPGARLVAEKVRLLSAMAGRFPRGQPEFNVKTDIPSARKVFEE